MTAMAYYSACVLAVCTALPYCLSASPSSSTFDTERLDTAVHEPPKYHQHYRHVFRPGSGAGARHDPLPLTEPKIAAGTIVRSDPGYRHPLLLRLDVGGIQHFTAVIAVITILAVFAMMMNNNARDTSHRIPPAYDPENELNYLGNLRHLQRLPREAKTGAGQCCECRICGHLQSTS